MRPQLLTININGEIYGRVSYCCSDLVNDTVHAYVVDLVRLNDSEPDNVAINVVILRTLML